MAQHNGLGSFSMEQAMAFAASPAGKQLIELMQSKSGVKFRLMLPQEIWNR